MGFGVGSTSYIWSLARKESRLCSPATHHSGGRCEAAGRTIDTVEDDVTNNSNATKY